MCFTMIAIVMIQFQIEVVQPIHGSIARDREFWGCCMRNNMNNWVIINFVLKIFLFWKISALLQYYFSWPKTLRCTCIVCLQITVFMAWANNENYLHVSMNFPNIWYCYTCIYSTIRYNTYQLQHISPAGDGLFWKINGEIVKQSTPGGVWI